MDEKLGLVQLDRDEMDCLNDALDLLIGAYGDDWLKKAVTNENRFLVETFDRYRTEPQRAFIETLRNKILKDQSEMPID